MAHTRIPEQEFEEFLRPRLGSRYNRALKLFRQCGKNLEFDVTNVLLQASEANQEKERVDEVLDLIEKHYDEHLKFQHPDARGLLPPRGNPTQALLLRICTDVLKLQPTAP